MKMSAIEREALNRKYRKVQRQRIIHDLALLNSSQLRAYIDWTNKKQQWQIAN